jgi:hypothetical protein
MKMNYEMMPQIRPLENEKNYKKTVSLVAAVAAGGEKDCWVKMLQDFHLVHATCLWGAISRILKGMPGLAKKFTTNHIT